jgi:hypothetical protein
MNWLDQNGMWLVLMCVLGTAILAGGWIQTGRKPLLYATAIPVVLGILILIAKQAIVTEQERVGLALHKIAGAIQQNDVDTVLTFIDPKSQAVIDQARQELPQYDFDEVNIKRNLEVTVFPDRNPPEAVAEFNVTVVVSERSGALQNQRVPRFAVVTFVKRDGQWRVASYEHHPPQQSMMRRDSPPDY